MSAAGCAACNGGFSRIGCRRSDSIGRRRVLATSYLHTTVEESRRAAIADVGGLTTLADLGIVDRRGAETELTSPSSGPIRYWDLLNLEAWARAHAN